MCLLHFQWIVFAISAIGVMPPLHDEGDAARKKLEKLVTDQVVRFYEVFEQRDLEAILSVVDTPWYHDGKAVLSSKEDVRSEFKVLLAKRRDVKAVKIPEIKAVLSYGDVRERIPAAEKPLLDQVVGQNDFFVLVMLKPEAGKNGSIENVVVLVKVREGVTKVVGVKN